jgi:hypothetical protein
MVEYYELKARPSGDFRAWRSEGKRPAAYVLPFTGGPFTLIAYQEAGQQRVAVYSRTNELIGDGVAHKTAQGARYQMSWDV